MGHLTGRTHHFFSDTELAAFLLLEWNPDVTDIREQFPLRIEDTLSVAEQANIRHPEAGGYHQIMSSDFVVDHSYSLEPGTSLAKLRALAALRALTFDISIPWIKLVAQDL
ncbi:TnsA endonuclease N-terminal domain-containing protein [Marinobacter sp. F3R11]|uniref:TnsA endonuclease N-terminal domain-containing protein n=1 Tax=Marinobacter sp. F3R11 TaxID=2267231 RepID=UPI000DEB24C3|nr:TnsA endonuclease N-terminal domain-containing protein [Marinobacter sp. F3R11]RBW52134.1 hypothetical protein DS878_02075 [Marinobacter sp. F3R11]